MKLLVGLGNPGSKYQTTRHNAGFILLDIIADKERITWSGDKFSGIFGKGRVLGQDCYLLKPQTYMNLSGECVRLFTRYFKIDPAEMVIVHDDIDTPAGKVKAKVGGGHGGNNGIRSIIDELSTADFHRIKIGVGRPEEGGKSVSGYVLDNFTSEELSALESAGFDAVMERLKNIFR